MDDIFSFSDWLRNELKIRKMTVTQLGELSGVSVKSLGHYVRGYRTPSLRTANYILAALGKRFYVVNQINLQEI